MATAVMPSDGLRFEWAEERSGPQRAALGLPNSVVDFDSVYAAYNRRVYAQCLRMVRDATEAEDLTQEVFLQLYRKIGTYRGESAFYTWLYRLVVNVVLMHMRRRRRVEVSLEDVRDSDGETVRHGSEGLPEVSFWGSPTGRIHLQRALEKLPSGSRSILVLHDVQGYEHHEIAAMMGRSIGNSKSQLHKARRRLRAILRPSQCEKQWGSAVGIYKSKKARRSPRQENGNVFA